MRIEDPAGIHYSRLVRHLRELQFSPLRLHHGSSVPLLVQRLRHKIKHINNHFPFVQVPHMVKGPVAAHALKLAPGPATVLQAYDPRIASEGLDDKTLDVFI